jgi:hypothetical protein
MAFVAIDINTIEVGDPITKEIMDLIKYNLDDLDTRVSGLSVSGGSIYILNQDYSLIGYSSTEQEIFHYKAKQSFSVNEFSVQLFTKQGVTSGNLVFDLQKSVDTNDANFGTILTSSLSFDFAVDADYLLKSAAINSGSNDFVSGDVLRIKVTGVPTGFYGTVLINIGAA